MKIYNTLTGRKESFVPLHPPTVSFYACGVTPYDEPHLGHLLTALRCNVIRRYLAYRGYEVTFVQNVTDIDDKIINRAKERGATPLELSEHYTAVYNRYLREFGIAAPDHEPKVTQYVPQIIQYIEKIIENGAAYVAETGDVYFDVSKFPSYGKLSHQKLDQVMEGTRENVREEKRNSLDFALWKRSEEEGASYDSPWGRGRPGWHIECSAMCNGLLGPRIDLHAGGLDLVFPHHENEIAQCESHNGCSFANTWMHMGLLMVEGAKMSKSLSNFITMEDALARYGAGLCTFTALRYHYRSPVNFSDALFDEMLNQLVDLYAVVEDLEQSSEGASPRFDAPSVVTLQEGFVQAMDNDFNTPEALVSFHDAAKRGKALLKQGDGREEMAALASKMRELGAIVFLFEETYSLRRIVEECLRFRSAGVKSETLTYDRLVEILRARASAREQRDYEAADRVRSLLSPYYITILDGDRRGWRFDPLER